MNIKHLILAVSVAMAFSSCHTDRSPLTYFTDIDTMIQNAPVGAYSVKIEPADELFITVLSNNPEATAPYNIPLSNPSSMETLGRYSQSYQQTYIVDSEGNILFPMLGKIHVAGMTTEELQKHLTQLISKEVDDPYVRVELYNFKVNVGGEVTHPGMVKVTTQRFSVLDALSAVGDLTPYAERNNVLVIREEDGKRTYGRINLNSSESFESPYFFLKQNDYVYVEPNKIRKDNSKYNQNNAFKLSVISTCVSAVSVLASLLIALVIRK